MSIVRRRTGKANWASVTIVALALLSAAACGRSEDDRRDAFYAELLEQDTPKQQAEQIASVYEGEIKREQPDEYSKLRHCSHRA